MFENEEGLKEGVMLKVYKFNSGMDGKALVSMVVRMQGPKCEQGNEVIGPLIQSEKEKAKLALDEFDKKNPAPKNSLLAKLSRKLSKAEKEYEEAYSKERGALVGKLGNPLFDFSNLEGEEAVKRVTAELLAKGLELKSDEQKSNGELMEQILHFA